MPPPANNSGNTGNNAVPDSGSSGNGGMPPQSGTGAGNMTGTGGSVSITTQVGTGGSLGHTVNIPPIPLSPPGGYSLFGGTLHMAGSLQYQKWSKFNQMCTSTMSSQGGNQQSNGTGAKATRNYWNQTTSSGYNYSAAIACYYKKSTSDYDLKIAAGARLTRIGSSGAGTSFSGFVGMSLSW